MAALSPTLNIFRSRSGVVFWLLWVAASFAGAILYFLPVGIVQLAFNLAGVSDPGASEVNLPVRALAAILCGAAIGLSMGLAQWLVLRRASKRTRMWIPATIAGYASIGLLPLIANAWQPGWVDWAYTLIVNGKLHWLARMQPEWTNASWSAGAVTLVLFGLVLGVVQWWALRGRVGHAGWWVAVSTIGWGVAALAGLDAVSWANFVTLVFLTPIAIGGAWLMWLIRSPAPQNSKPEG